MSDYLIHRIGTASNITVRLDTEVTEGRGDSRLEAVMLRDRRTGASEEVRAGALFAVIGTEPRTEWLADIMERDSRGDIVTGHERFATGRPPQGWPLQRPPLLLETSIRDFRRG